jgi:hypothetical protein
MEAQAPQVQFDVEDSIVWITASGEPMIDMSGGKEMDEFLNAFEWRGFINHIHVVGPWWVIDAPFSTVGRNRTWNEREWRDYWPDADDRPLEQPLLASDLTGSWSAVQLPDLVLRMSDDVTPLESGDNRTSGVDWSLGRLPAGFPRTP